MSVLLGITAREGRDSLVLLELMLTTREQQLKLATDPVRGVCHMNLLIIFSSFIVYLKLLKNLKFIFIIF